MENHINEKALGYIWTLENEGADIEKKAIKENFGIETANELFEDMRRANIVDINDQKVALTALGTKQAELIIRRHRIAERLFFDVLDFNSDEFESNTCAFDRFIADDLVTGICTLLGHPTTCPHGNLIPQTDCCAKAEKELKSLMYPLSKLRMGDLCKVVHVNATFNDQANIIVNSDVLPGANLRVHQTSPAITIQIGDAYIAIDKNTADQIYVHSLQ